MLSSYDQEFLSNVYISPHGEPVLTFLWFIQWDWLKSQETRTLLKVFHQWRKSRLCLSKAHEWESRPIIEAQLNCTGKNFWLFTNDLLSEKRSKRKAIEKESRLWYKCFKMHLVFLFFKMPQLDDSVSCKKWKLKANL